MRYTFSIAWRNLWRHPARSGPRTPVRRWKQKPQDQPETPGPLRPPASGRPSSVRW